MKKEKQKAIAFAQFIVDSFHIEDDINVENLYDEWENNYQVVQSKKEKKIKYFTELSEEGLEKYDIDPDKVLQNPEEYLRECDFLPSMSTGRDYTPEAKDGETIHIKLGNRTFAFEVETGECCEATWCHTINETDFHNFRETTPK